MSKKDVVEKEGIVKETLPSGLFKIVFADETEALGVLSGKMRFHHIRLLPGDKVKIEFTPYDLKRGRITYRTLVR